MPDEVKEEVVARYAYHFVGDLHKQTETIRRLEPQSVSNVHAEVLGSGTRFNSECLCDNTGW